jgi:hypothetical protein
MRRIDPKGPAPEPVSREQQANKLLATATKGGDSPERLRSWSSVDRAFDELRRVLEGWEPEKAAAPASGSTPTPAPATPTVPGDRAAIVKLVRAQMAQVLRTRPPMLERQAAKKAAKVAYDERDAAYKAIKLPSTAEDRAVTEFVARQQSLQLQYRQAATAFIAATAAESAAELEHKRAACRLQVMVAEAVLVLPDIAADDSIKAAQYIIQQALPAVSSENVARILAAPIPESEPAAATSQADSVTATLSAEQARQMGEIEQATLALAKAGAAAVELAATVSAAIGAYNDTRQPTSFKRPVRPTEEEVQRYLTQMETFMRRRQTARQELTRHLTARDAAKKAIEQGSENLRQAMAQVQGTTCLELAVVQECASAVLGKAEIASQGMCDWFERPKGIDDVSYPDASRRDTRGIKAMNKQMREVAVCFGKLNEAETSLAFANKTTVTSARNSGIAACHTFDECAQWSAETRQAQAKAERDRVALQTKIELLHAEVEAHTTEVAESVRDLYRLVVCTKPSESAALPCDELRALLNAAAWMVRKEGRDEAHDREGDYPLY